MKDLILVVALCVLGMPSTAHAYIDPGTSDGLLQILLIAAVIVAVFWRKIKKLFSRSDTKK